MGFSLMQRVGVRNGREKEPSSAGYGLKVAQNRAGLRRQRDTMWPAHFSFSRRYRPNARVQVEFRPFRRA